MGFTTACFIRKNNPELRNKLKDLGYCVIGNSLPCIKTNIQGKLDIAEQAYTFELNDRIDCGINEELFLAISALRDDSDINQWYWYNDKLFKSKGGGSTILMNGDRSIKLEIPNMKSSYYEAMKSKLRKATVQELIEHFK